MRSFSQTVRDGVTVGQERLQNMSMVGHDSTEKSIVSFISKTELRMLNCTVCTFAAKAKTFLFSAVSASENF